MYGMVTALVVKDAASDTERTTGAGAVGVLGDGSGAG